MTSNNSIKALGVNYFTDSKFPLGIRKVDRINNISHDDDLTDVEHFHDFTEIAFIIKGKGLQVIEQQEYVISAGDVFVLQGNQRHFYKNAKKIEMVNVMFNDSINLELISEEIKKMDGFKALFILESQYRATHHFKNKLHLSRQQLAKIEVLLNSMIQEQKNEEEGYARILKNRLEELIIHLSRYYSKLEATEARALVRIGRTVDFMEANFSDKIYLEQLADMSFMSTRNFQRVFKKAVGSSPSSYLMQIRLQKARKLLRETNLSIENIANDTGFGDGNYFIKCFKKEHGITPVKFRLKSQNS